MTTWPRDWPAPWRASYRLWGARAAWQRRRDEAIQATREFLSACQRPYIAFGGGKDATVVLGLVAECGRTDVPVFTQEDDLDWPDKHEHCAIVLRTLGFTAWHVRQSRVSAVEQLTTARVWDSQSPRGTFSHVVAEYQREIGADGVLLGLRRQESRGRRCGVRGTVYHTACGLLHGCPIASWRGEDVLAYLLRHDLPLMDCYLVGPEPPHEQRMSWPLVPELFRHGQAAWLRRHFPAYWRRLAEAVPAIRDMG